MRSGTCLHAQVTCRQRFDLCMVPPFAKHTAHHKHHGRRAKNHTCVFTMPGNTSGESVLHPYAHHWGERVSQVLSAEEVSTRLPLHSGIDEFKSTLSISFELSSQVSNMSSRQVS
jgi:hypothetical protein